MITSNNINVRNLFLTKELFNKTITASEGFVLPNGGAVIEVVLSVATADSTSYVTVIKQSEAQSSAINPIIYDDNFNQVNTRRINLNRTGVITFYVDAKTFNTSLVVTKGNGTPVLSARIGVYNDKNILNSNNIKQKSLATVKFNGLNSDAAVTNFNVEGYRYAIFDCAVASGANASSSLWITGYNDLNAASTLELIDSVDLKIIKTAANTNGIVLNENKHYRFFVNLGANNIKTIEMNRNITGDLIGSVSLVRLTNDNLYSNSSTIEDKEVNVLFEDDKIKAEFKGNISDAWNSQIVSFSGANVYLSDDINDLRKKTFNLQSVITTESSAINNVYIMPYDDNQQNTALNFRIAVILKTGIMYINKYNGGTEADFGRANFWECRDTNRRLITNDLSLKNNPLYKYDNTLTATHYGRSRTKDISGKTFIEYQGMNVVQWLGPLCRTKKMVSWGHYLGDSRRICFFTSTNGGADWVLGYDFVRRIKPDNYNSNINTSQFAEYSGGLNMSKIISNPPTNVIKEPTFNFSYNEVTIQSITKGTSTIVNSIGHNLIDGDIVVFEGTAQDDNWSSLLCVEKTPLYFKQNAYSVLKIDENSFYIKEYLGSYDFPLSIRHIHAVNEVNDGVTISCGEYYPNGWMLLYKQQLKDNGTVISSFDFPKNNTYRLNSGVESLQRPCGFIYNNDIDPLIIFGSDVSDKNIGNKTPIAGRTETLRRSPVGIWKGRMSDIDDWSKFECKLDIGEVCIWMYQHSNYIICYFQSGANAISYDYGDNWTVFKTGNNLINGVFKNNLIIGNGYMIKYK